MYRGIIRFALVVLALNVIAGCASRKPYETPNDGPIANVTFVAGSGARAALVMQQGDSSCNVMYDIASLSEDPNRGIVVTRMERVKEKVVNVSAEKPFRVQIDDNRHTAFGMAYCGSAFEFKPLSGNDYKIIWSFDAFTCGIQVLVKASNGIWEGNDLTPIKRCNNY